MNTRTVTMRFLLLLTVLIMGHSVAMAQSGAAIMKRFEDRYKSVNTLQADFTQTLSSPSSKTSPKFTGSLTLQGDKYFVKTNGQTLVTDGKTLWIYNPAQKQVLINNKADDETTFSLNDFFRRHNELFNVAAARKQQYGGASHFKVQLKAKTADNFFREVTFYLREKDNLVTRIEVLDANQARMTFDLTNIRINPSVAAGAFTFKVPKGVEVVDLRS